MSDALHVIDGIQGVEVGLFACAGVDEVAIRGQTFSDFSTDAGVGAGHQNGVLLGFGRFLCVAYRGRNGKQDREPPARPTSVCRALSSPQKRAWHVVMCLCS
jgi:hypothetical protein